MISYIDCQVGLYLIPSFYGPYGALIGDLRDDVILKYELLVD